MLVPNNHTLWKHKWGWFSGGRVWDKIPSERSGEAEWSSKRRTMGEKDDADFVTVVALKCVKHPDTQTENRRGNQNKNNRRFLEYWDPSICTRPAVTTVSMCGDSSVVESCVTVHCAVGTKSRKRLHKTLHSWWKRKVADLLEKNGDYVKHIVRECCQEADYLANLREKKRQQ